MYNFIIYCDKRDELYFATAWTDVDPTDSQGYAYYSKNSMAEAVGFVIAIIKINNKSFVIKKIIDDKDLLND